MLLLEMVLAFAITFTLYLLLKKTAGKLYRSYLLWERLLEEEVRKQESSKKERQEEEEQKTASEEDILEKEKKGEGYGQDR